jgi:hypothetical protein
MSRWIPGQAERGTNSFHRARFGRRRSDGVQGGEWQKEGSVCCRSIVFRIAKLSALCALAFVFLGSEISRAQRHDFGVYARAVEYCRGVVKRPMALDLDKRVLCFDGEISSGSDFSVAGAVGVNGLFVVRSPGGEGPTAIALANLIRDRRATVVVYDYCFSACASFLLIASDAAFVMKDTLVAWHHTTWPLCATLEESKDGGPKRLEKSACSDTPPEYQRGYREAKERNDEFYAARVVDPLFEYPPESFTIRKILRTMFEGTGTYPDVAWTWNPRNYARSLKTKITYEAYPSSQAEVDAMVSKLRLGQRVLYDP